LVGAASEIAARETGPLIQIEMTIASEGTNRRITHQALKLGTAGEECTGDFLAVDVCLIDALSLCSDEGFCTFDLSRDGSCFVGDVVLFCTFPCVNGDVHLFTLFAFLFIGVHTFVMYFRRRPSHSNSDLSHLATVFDATPISAANWACVIQGDVGGHAAEGRRAGLSRKPEGLTNVRIRTLVEVGYGASVVSSSR